MLIRCPVCGSQNSLDALIDNEPAAQALLLALKLTPVGKSLIKYLGLFRPVKSQLSMSRVAAILGEITPLIESQRIERNGIEYNVPMAIWESSIAKVLEARDMGRLNTPIKGHGYLFEVIVGELARTDADKQARELAKKQAEKQHAEKVLENAQKMQEKRDETPRPRSEYPKMPEEFKAITNQILHKQKQEVALLTPEQKEAKKREDIARLQLTPEQIQQLQQRRQQAAGVQAPGL